MAGASPVFLVICTWVYDMICISINVALAVMMGAELAV